MISLIGRFPIRPGPLERSSAVETKSTSYDPQDSTFRDGLLHDMIEDCEWLLRRLESILTVDIGCCDWMLRLAAWFNVSIDACKKLH